MGLLISIVIPVYNAERYLRRCMGTVLGQSYKQIEIVLVNDGSTDDSAHLCDEYAKLDGRVRVIHQQNRGASIARFNGLKLSRGEYVAFVDSDDWVENDYILCLYELIIKYHVSVSACQVKRGSIGQVDEPVSANCQTSLLEFDQLMPRFLHYEFWGFVGKLYRREVLLDGIVFPEATISEDYFVMAQLFLKARKMAVTSQPLYVYECHSESLSHQKLSKRAFEEFDNVRGVHELMGREAPKYADDSFANVIGSCMKLHLLYFSSHDANEYLDDYLTIHNYLKEHISNILKSCHLNIKTKIVVLGLFVFPQTTAKFMNRNIYGEQR